jgi:hypothetical protein
MKINILQKVVLIVGSVFLLVILFIGFRQVWDWTTILMRSTAICLVCGLLFFGLANRSDTGL